MKSFDRFTTIYDGFDQTIEVETVTVRRYKPADDRYEIRGETDHMGRWMWVAAMGDAKAEFYSIEEMLVSGVLVEVDDE